jgi:hypothetical protein
MPPGIGYPDKRSTLRKMPRKRPLSNAATSRPIEVPGGKDNKLFDVLKQRDLDRTRR